MKDVNEVRSATDQLRSLSLSQLKALRRRNGQESKRPRVAPLVPQPREGALPLSYAQERLWFLDQLGLAGAAYNMLVALRLTGELDIEAVNRALAELIRRHESLRTRFEPVDGTPCQIIDPPADFQLQQLGLPSTAIAEQREAKLADCIREARLHRFDLQKDGVCRASLVRLTEHEHVLLITIHHIAADGWSLGLLRRELSTLYNAYARGEQSPLHELSVQYADYAQWQRHWLQGVLLHEQLHYWSTQLAGAPQQLELPTDRPRPPMESFRGAELTIEIPASLVEGLRSLAQGSQATLFMVVLAAYQLLLARWSGQSDIVIGAPIAGRRYRETEDLIGSFVNTLVLRTDVAAGLTFRQLLQRVKETALGAFAHQDLPFEVLVKELRPDRNLTRQPVFQVALTLQNYPEASLELTGLKWSAMEAERSTTHLDLTLYLSEHAAGLSATFEYATDLFDASTIGRLAAQWRVLLAAIVATPDREVYELPLLDEAERQRVLTAWNATNSAYPRAQSVHEIFEAQAQRTPDADALEQNDVALSYAALNARANQLARYLRQQGMQTGELVPVVIPRSIDMVIAQLAVLKNGGVYVPIDPSLPAERRNFMIENAGARRVLGHQAAVSQGGSQWIDCTAAVIDGFSTANVESTRLPAAAPAYMMFTSGSTGTPKGVLVPHRGVCRLVLNNRYARIEPTDRVAHCSNPAFDASTFEIWGALLNGASVVIVPQPVLLDSARFVELLEKKCVTTLFLTVGLLMQYVDELAPVLGKLRYLMTGGDVVEPGLIRKILRNGPPAHLLNVYGPTESTTYATTHLIEAVAEDARSIPIGKPISNTRTYLLDSRLQPTPIGVIGELYIGGDGLALGYHNRPALTAERFIADPFSGEPSSRLYKTGDLARWRADGTIEFIGRNDTQVKLRGFRIELGEIEVQLTRHPAVKDAVVVIRPDSSGEKALVAYVTCQAKQALHTDQLREHAAGSLPEYMIPSAFVVMDTLPLTANGKIDRRALPAPQLEAYATRAYQPPDGPLEQTLSALWHELLPLSRIGREDNFFELGGHSLHGIKLIASIAERVGVRLSPILIFQHPTIRQMARAIEAMQGPGDNTAASEALEYEEGSL